MFKPPKTTPWGAVEYCDVLCPGVFLITAEHHGGTMISKDIAAFLSPAARECSFKYGRYICFEQERQEDVALRELLDKKLWAVPNRVRNRAVFEEAINRNIRQYNPAYWRLREMRRAKLEAARPVTETARTDR